jgi:hypothetical protein
MLLPDLASVVAILLVVLLVVPLSWLRPWFPTAPRAQGHHARPVHLLFLTGDQGAGKDTVAAELVDCFGFTRVAFADPLRAVAVDAAHNLLGLTNVTNETFTHRETKDTPLRMPWDAHMTPRNLLQYIGTVMRDKVSPDTWVQATVATIARAAAAADHNTSLRFVFSDTRFPNEHDAVVRMVLALNNTVLHNTLWRVVDPNQTARAAQGLHVSDTAMDNVPVSQVVINNKHHTQAAVPSVVRAALQREGAPWNTL